jgi:hypothetical protein
MPILVRERDEHVERIAWQWKEVLGLFALTPSSRHGGIVAILGIANNGIVDRDRRLPCPSNRAYNPLA